MLWLGKPDVEVTWEPAESLSKEVIEEYEKGIRSEVETKTTIQYGQEKSILAVNKDDILQETTAKKTRVERTVIKNSSG